MTSFHAFCAGVTPCHLLLETPASTISRLYLLCNFFFQCTRVGCATDDEFVPFASSLEFAVKTLGELYCLESFYDLGIVTLLLFAVDKHLATR